MLFYVVGTADSVLIREVSLYHLTTNVAEGVREKGSQRFGCFFQCPTTGTLCAEYVQYLCGMMLQYSHLIKRMKAKHLNPKFIAVFHLPLYKRCKLSNGLVLSGRE